MMVVAQCSERNFSNERSQHTNLYKVLSCTPFPDNNYTYLHVLVRYVTCIQLLHCILVIVFDCAYLLGFFFFNNLHVYLSGVLTFNKAVVLHLFLGFMEQIQEVEYLKY